MYLKHIPLLLIYCLSHVFCGEQSNVIQEINDNIKHADTYYWLSRARGSPVTDIDKNIFYLTKAKNALDKIELTEETKILRLKVTSGLDECKIQRDEALEELHNYTPLFSLLTGTEDIIEYFDNPFEVAIKKSINGVIEGKAFFARYAFLLFVIVVTEPSDDSELIIEIAHHYINNNTAFYALTTHELAGIMNEDEMALLHKIDEHPDILNRINQSVASKGIGIFEVVFNDQVDNLYYASSYYKFWNPDKGKFDNQMGSYEFVETPNRGGFFLILFLLLGFPITFIYNRLNPGSEGTFAPLWLSSAAAGFAIISAVFLFKGISVMNINGGQFIWSLNGIGWVVIFTLIISLLPLLIVYLSASRIDRISSILNNPETVSALTFGTFLGSFMFLAIIATVRLGIQNSLGIFILSIICTAIAAFFFGRAYSKNAITNDKAAGVEYILILIGLIIYSAFILKWDFQLAVFSSTALLLFTTLSYLIPSKVFQAIDAIKSKAVTEEVIEGESGIAWLRKEIREPAFFNKPWKDEFKSITDFVTVGGMEDPEIEVVFIEADMGSGKTRVAKEIAQSIKKEHDKEFRTTVLFGDCDEFNNEADLVPYEPFAQALSSFLEIGRFANPAEKAEQMKNSLVGQGLKTALGVAGAGALGVLLDADDSEQGKRTDTREMTKIIAGTLTELSNEKDGKEGKVVFIIDDTQWMDEDTFELLKGLFDILSTNFENNQVSFIFTSRIVNEEDKVKKYLKELEAAKVIKIDNTITPEILENEEVIDGVLDNLKFDYRTKLAFKKYLSEHGIQRPLHCLQSIETAIEKEMIKAFGDSFILDKNANLKELPPPNDFMRMVEEELSGLDPKLIGILQCAAIMGKSFKASIISEIHKMDMLEFLELVKGAEDRNMVKDVSTEDDVYEFIEKRMVGIFRNLGYTSDQSSTITQMVREYHKRFVEIKRGEIEENRLLPNQIPYRDILSLASHTKAIPDVYPEDAILYNQLAAERSYKRGLFNVASGYFKNALEFTKDSNLKDKDEKLVNLYLSYSECLLDEQAKFDDVEILITEAKNISNRLKKGSYDSIEVEIRLLDSLNNYRAEKWSEAASTAEMVVNSPKASKAQKMRGKFYHIAAGISRKDEPEKSRDEHMKLLVKSADLLEQKTLGDPERIELLKVRSEALNNLGFVLLHNLNLAEEALPYFTDAIEIKSRPEINDQKGIGIANGGLGDCYKELGEIEKASEHYKINLDISQNNGDKQGIVRMTSMLGGIKYEIAENENEENSRMELIDEAEDYYEESLATAEDQENIIGMIFAFSGLIKVIVLSGHYEKCERVFLMIKETAPGIKKAPDFAKDALKAAAAMLSENTDAYDKDVKKIYKMMNK